MAKHGGCWSPHGGEAEEAELSEGDKLRRATREVSRQEATRRVQLLEHHRPVSLS